MSSLLGTLNIVRIKKKCDWLAWGVPTIRINPKQPITAATVRQGVSRMRGRGVGYLHDKIEKLKADLAVSQKALREIGKMDSVDDCGSDCSSCREKIELAKNAIKEG